MKIYKPLSEVMLELAQTWEGHVARNAIDPERGLLWIMFYVWAAEETHDG